jgi:hypothetical protein
METKEKSYKDYFIEFTNEKTTIDAMSIKYNCNISVMEANIKYGREEHFNTNYWNQFLKPILKK